MNVPPHPAENAQGVPPEHHDAELAAAETSPSDSGSDDPDIVTTIDPAAVESELAEPDLEAAHAKFLETYEPVLTRHPQALADERAAQDAAEAEERARLEQEQAERDEVTRRQLEAQAQADAEAAAYKAEHFPGT